jgi:hypothetical protein
MAKDTSTTVDGKSDVNALAFQTATVKEWRFRAMTIAGLTLLLAMVTLVPKLGIHW